MTLESQLPPRASKRSLCLAALCALLVFPSFFACTNREVWAAPKEDLPSAPTAKPDAKRESEFPFAVPFEQGATRFLKGDDITILEIRGTAPTFIPGHIYWIRGSYALASHDRAHLSAYVTATSAENGRSATMKVQSTVVNKGSGTFALFLPMTYKGLPHVSFYPDDGQGFGGNYFGTGDSVMKKWWGEKKGD